MRGGFGATPGRGGDWFCKGQSWSMERDQTRGANGRRERKLELGGDKRGGMGVIF